MVVDLQLTNNKDETKTFMDANAKIKTSDGKEYETSDKALHGLRRRQPDAQGHPAGPHHDGKLAFELPPSKVTGSTLVIEDLWGSGEIKVGLGL